MTWLDDTQARCDAHPRTDLIHALSLLREALALLGPRFVCRAHPGAPCGCRDVRRRKLIEAAEKGPT